MYVNNIRVERISSCCEYKYKKGAKLGTGTLQFISVEGAAPCFKCNVRNNIIKVTTLKLKPLNPVLTDLTGFNRGYSG